MIPAIPLRAAGALAVGLLAATVATAQVTPEAARELTSEQLRRAYLECLRASREERLSLGDAMDCSVIYETLKRRDFGGDYERLLAWSRQQQQPAPAAPPAR